MEMTNDDICKSHVSPESKHPTESCSDITHNKDVIDITIKTHKNIFSLLEPHINKNPKGVFTYQHNVHVKKKVYKLKCSDDDILNSIIIDCDSSSSFSLLIWLLTYLSKRNDQYNKPINKEDGCDNEKLLEKIFDIVIRNKEDSDILSDQSNLSLIERLITLNVDCTSDICSTTNDPKDNPKIKNAMIDRIKYLWNCIYDSCRRCNDKHYNGSCESVKSDDMNDMINMCIRVSWNFSPDAKANTIRYECKNGPEPHVNESPESQDQEEDWIEYNCSDPDCLCRKLKIKHKCK